MTQETLTSALLADWKGQAVGLWKSGHIEVSRRPVRNQRRVCTMWCLLGCKRLRLGVVGLVTAWDRPNRADCCRMPNVRASCDGPQLSGKFLTASDI
eukprot:351955-Chlamydomonas_euryale.AAC.7